MKDRRKQHNVTKQREMDEGETSREQQKEIKGPTPLTNNF